MSYLSIAESAYDDQSTIELRTAALRGAGILAMTFHSISHQQVIEVSPGDRSHKWWRVDNDYMVRPLACTINSYHNTTIDTLTLEADTLSILGDVIVGDFTTLDMPFTHADDCNTALNSVFAVGLKFLLDGSIYASYAAIQAAHLLMSLYVTKIVEAPLSAHFSRELTPYDL